MDKYLQRLHHETPGWVHTEALFHIRIRAAGERSLTEPRLAGVLLDDARQYHASGLWWCKLMLLMPDHLHALLTFPPESDMSTVSRNWKRGAARLYGVAWQANYFDHRIRHEKENNETWNYIRRNPIAKGLCSSEGAWPFWWSALSANTPAGPERASALGQGAPPL
jgi:REP element-mobilizing transposase RayT